MKDRQKIFLDKVVKLLVGDTILDYDKKKIYPSYLRPTQFYFFDTFIFLRHTHSFSEYCKSTYGLTDEEIKYVWKIYKDIIKDKISNREP